MSRDDATTSGAPSETSTSPANSTAVAQAATPAQPATASLLDMSFGTTTAPQSQGSHTKNNLF